MTTMRTRAVALIVVALVALLAACGSDPDPLSRTPDEQAASSLGLTGPQAETLASLEQVDDYPLYTMHHYAPEPLVVGAAATHAFAGQAWGCSLFAAVGDPEAGVFGRNFDWEFSPALLLFNHPSDGYSSAAMVDIEYLGFPGDQSSDLTKKPLDEILGLLDAHSIPFDGMNEAGLVVGMAAVPETYVPQDPTRETVDSLGIIRVMLDRAATVDEAVELMHSYNVDFTGQTPLHYLLADASGDSALIEYLDGELSVLRPEGVWLHATNFLVSPVDSTSGHCARYDTITAELQSNEGTMDFDDAMKLLERVAQPHTQWSMVYGIDSSEIRVVVGQNYGTVHIFSLEMD